MKEKHSGRYRKEYPIRNKIRAECPSEILNSQSMFSTHHKQRDVAPVRQSHVSTVKY